MATHPTALIAADARQSWFAQPEVVDDHAGLAQREPGEHTERVERDQGGDVALEHDDEHTREEGEEHDAVGEHETVTTVDQLSWQVAVAGDDR